MLKRSKYPNDGHLVDSSLPEFNEVAYLIVQKKCYFTGLSRGASTINNAERIIVAIAKQEEVLFVNFRYFDIQTYKGYHRYFPGEYEVNELIFDVAREMTETEVYEQLNIDKESGYEVLGDWKQTIEECEYIPSVSRWKSAFLSADVLKSFKQYIGVEIKSLYPIVSQESEGLYIAGDKEGMCLFIDDKGSPAFDGKFADVTGFQGGVAWVCDPKTRLWAQIDKKGKVRSEWIEFKKFWKL